VARPALRRAAGAAARAITQATGGRAAVYIGGAGAPERAPGLIKLPPTLTAAAEFLALSAAPGSRNDIT
jgi:hypothetical protein